MVQVPLPSLTPSDHCPSYVKREFDETSEERREDKDGDTGRTYFGGGGDRPRERKVDVRRSWARTTAGTTAAGGGGAAFFDDDEVDEDEDEEDSESLKFETTPLRP